MLYEHLTDEDAIIRENGAVEDKEDSEEEELVASLAVLRTYFYLNIF